MLNRVRQSMWLIACVSLLSYGGAALSVGAGKFNDVLKIGDPAPVWKDLPGTDGKKHDLADFDGRDVVVVVFTCNSCPTAMEYENRIIELAKRYDTANPKSRVGLVAVCVNDLDADRLPKMIERAKEKGFNFPYIYDASQKLARDFGAEYTPEFFVLDKARRIAYMGAMDDKINPAQVKEQYVVAAIEALLAGQAPAVAETQARGCRIVFARKRR
jgi:peroxiredoxin